MEGFMGFVVLVLLALVAFIGFAIYFFFKMLQFVIQAIDLYKDMRTRQDMMIKLLKDINPNQKSPNDKISQIEEGTAETSTFRQNLTQTLPNDTIIPKKEIAETENGETDKKTWKCTCGAENEESLSNCSKCSKFKPPESRWG
jgi:hypothetical protein